MSRQGSKQEQNDVDEAGGQNGIKVGIDELINQERVVIFSKASCPFCDDAKKVFDKLGQSYSAIELNDHPKMDQVQSVLKEMTGASTVPRVFVDGQCIGGGTDTVQLFQDGKLEEMLNRGSAESVRADSSPEKGSGEKPF